MGPLQFSQLALFALTLVSPALACVQFSANINYDNSLFNAALTDNGAQTCQLTNYKFVIGSSTIALSCIGGYSATFTTNSHVVTYNYPGYSGSFGTTETSYSSGNGDYFTANVWGC